MLYENPASGKSWLSPAYDIVNTTVYLPADTLALKLSRSKDFPNRTIMTRFGREHCHLTEKQAEAVIDECIAAVHWGIDQFSGQMVKVECEGRTLFSEMVNGVGRLMNPAQKQSQWKGEVRLPKRTR